MLLDMEEGTSRPPTPGELLKQVAMPGWIELHMRQIKLPTESSSRRFATVGIDEWSDQPVAAPDDADAPSTSPPTAEDVEREVSLAARTAAAARAACEKRRKHPNLSSEDMKTLRSMHDTEEGKLAYAATVIAAEIEQSPVWSDDAFVDDRTRVDLIEQVTGIVSNCRALLHSKERLGKRPSGALAKDAEVLAIYERRVQGHDERFAAICARIASFLGYRDHIKECETLQEKLLWIEKHDTDEATENYMRAAEDHVAGSELSRAAAEVVERTRIATELLGMDAERLDADSRRSRVGEGDSAV